MPDLTGQTLKGRYRIDELIGRGGMAEVYKAWDVRRQYHVAVKVMREDLAEDLEFLKRFKREAGALSALSHANIVRFYSFEREGPLAFIVMDYVEGTTLRRLILEAEGAAMPLDKVLPVIQQVCAALHYAHGENVLHRDVKPGNIMIDAHERVLVADFGIAKAADAATATTVMPGTPAYMSPEQCRSELLDARTDVYALGIVAYEMLAGRRPFVGDTGATTGSTREKLRWEQMHADPPPLRKVNPEVPPELEAVVLKALAKEPADRWPTVLAFWQALERTSGPPSPELQAKPAREQPQNPHSAVEKGKHLPVAEPMAAEEPSFPSAPERAAAGPAVEEESAQSGPSSGPAAPAVERVAPAASLPARRVPGWAWALLAVLVLGIAWMIARSGAGNNAPVEPVVVERVVTATTIATATAPPAEDTATPVPVPTRTRTPTAIPTCTHTPTRTPRPMQSNTSTPTPTPTPAPTRTPSPPTATPTKAVQEELVYTLPHPDAVHGVAFSPDGTILATGCDDGQIQLWQARDGTSIRTLKGHTGIVNDIVFSPDGSILASASHDKTIRLWRASDGKLLRTLDKHRGFILSLAFARDGSILASGGGHGDQGTRWWDVSDWTQIRRSKPEEQHGDVQGLAFSPDGKTLATGVSGPWDKAIRLYRVSDGQLLATLTPPTGGIQSVDFSPDGTLLAAGSGAPDSRTIHLWRTSDWEFLDTLRAHKGSQVGTAYDVAFSPDGTILATGGSDATVRLWRVSDWKSIETLKGHEGLVLAIAWSRDGKLLATGSWDETVKVWRVTGD